MCDIQKIKDIIQEQKESMKERLINEANVEINKESLDFLTLIYNIGQKGTPETQMVYEIYNTLNLVLILEKYKNEINEFLLNLKNHSTQTVDSLRTLINVDKIPEDKLIAFSMAFILYTDFSGLDFMKTYTKTTENNVLSRVISTNEELKK